MRARPLPTLSVGDVARFLSRIDKTGDCWVWIGPVERGYGVQSVKSQPCRVHRLTFPVHGLPIDDDLTVDHLCRNTLCVRPEHLRQVPNETNVTRMWASRPRALARETCRRGHQMTPANTYRGRDSRGFDRVECRRCHADRQARRKRASA